MSEIRMTLRFRQPKWRAVVCWFWVRGLVLQDLVFPGTVDLDSSAEKIARFSMVIEVNG